MALFTFSMGVDLGGLEARKSSSERVRSFISGRERQSSSSSGYSTYSSLFSFLRVSIRYRITSFSGKPWVQCRQKMKHQAPIPKKAVGNQLFISSAQEISLMKGATVLPICPTTLVHPKPRLLISVGYSSAIQTQKMDQKLQRTNRSIMRIIVSTHLNTSPLSGDESVMRKPSKRQNPADIPIPNKVVFFLLHLSMVNCTSRQPAISLTPKMTWLTVLVNPTELPLSCEEQYMIWMPKRIAAADMEVHRMLRYLKRSLNPNDLCSSKNSSSDCFSILSTASMVNSCRLFVLAMMLSINNASSEPFFSPNMGVSSMYRKTSTNSTMKSTSMMYAISSQVSVVAKMRAIVVSPKAQVICTPTPYLALDLPRQIQLMKEKQRVMAGLVPNPIRKRPSPIILEESAMQMIITATVPTLQAARIANFLPQLSAMYGITKKPKMAPMKSMACSRATQVSWLGQMRKVSNSKTMDEECVAISAILASSGREQMCFSQAYCSAYSGLTQVQSFSKKNPMPNSSQEVRNHMREKMMNDCVWYLPSPLIWSIRCSAGESYYIGLAGSSGFTTESQSKDCCIQTIYKGTVF